MSGAGKYVVGISPNIPWQLPSTSVLDTSLARDFKIGEAGNLGASIDVLNALNEDVLHTS